MGSGPAGPITGTVTGGRIRSAWSRDSPVRSRSYLVIARTSANPGASRSSSTRAPAARRCRPPPTGSRVRPDRGAEARQPRAVACPQAAPRGGVVSPGILQIGPLGFSIRRWAEQDALKTKKSLRWVAATGGCGHPGTPVPPRTWFLGKIQRYNRRDPVVASGVSCPPKISTSSFRRTRGIGGVMGRSGSGSKATSSVRSTCSRNESARWVLPSDPPIDTMPCVGWVSPPVAMGRGSWWGRFSSRTRH